jgi:ribosome-associated toxin RatA of RatAB toxin-antitoxin module
MPSVRGVLAQSSLAALALAAAPAHARLVAGASHPAPAYIRAADPGDAPRLSSVPIPGSSLARGRAVVDVRAPLARVREVVLDFPRYPEFVPHYEACRVLGTTASGGRDVYMRLEAVHGVVKMWARIEVAKPVVEGGAETYRSRYVDGNIRDLSATWTVRRVGEALTELSVEVFMDPALPLPASVVNGENLDGARLAALAFKGRAEGRKPAER